MTSPTSVSATLLPMSHSMAGAMAALRNVQKHCIMSPMLGAGFHVVYHFFGLPPSANLAELEAKGRRFCDTDFAAIAAGRGAEIHVETYCFRWAASSRSTRSLAPHHQARKQPSRIL